MCENLAFVYRDFFLFVVCVCYCFLAPLLFCLFTLGFVSFWCLHMLLTCIYIKRHREYYLHLFHTCCFCWTARFPFFFFKTEFGFASFSFSFPFLLLMLIFCCRRHCCSSCCLKIHVLKRLNSLADRLVSVFSFLFCFMFVSNVYNSRVHWYFLFLFLFSKSFVFNISNVYDSRSLTSSLSNQKHTQLSSFSQVTCILFLESY